MIRTSLFVIITTFLLATTIFGFQKERRVALVLSNTNYAYEYKDGSYFNTPTPDVALTLSKLGFEVIESIEPTRELLVTRMKEFVNSLDETDVGLIYYSGRMVQASGRNYIIPTDISKGELLTPELNAVALDPVLYEMERRVKHSFVFLNACKLDIVRYGSIFTQKMLQSCRGLEPLGTDSNVVVTHANQTSDRIISHRKNEAVFVKALTSNLLKADLPIHKVLQNVYKDVHVATGAEQTPWSENGAGKRFVFYTGGGKSYSRDEIIRPNMASIIPIGVEKTTRDIASNTPLKTSETTGSNGQQTKKENEANSEEPTDIQMVAINLPDPERFLAQQKYLATGTKKQLRMDRKTAIHVIQKKLTEFSCYRGRIDGIWGRLSKRAVSSFRKRTKNRQLKRVPDVELYKAVATYTGPVCGKPCSGDKRLNRQKKCEVIVKNDLPFIPVITNPQQQQKKIARRSKLRKKYSRYKKKFTRYKKRYRVRKRYRKRKYARSRYKVKKRYTRYKKRKRYAKRYKRKVRRKYRRYTKYKSYSRKYRRKARSAYSRKRRYSRKKLGRSKKRRVAYYQSRNGSPYHR